MSAYRFGVAAFAVVLTALGLAILGLTAARVGGSTGFVVGALFTALGCGRAYLLLRH